MVCYDMVHLSQRTTNSVDLLCIVAEQTPVGTITAKRILELSENLPVTVKKKGIILNKTTKMKIVKWDNLQDCNDSSADRTKTNENKQSERIQNEEIYALNEVEMSGCIPYGNNVFTGSARGKNVFGLDKNNAAFPVVAKTV